MVAGNGPQAQAAMRNPGFEFLTPSLKVKSLTHLVNSFANM
jgi:hypothetical protein